MTTTAATRDPEHRIETLCDSCQQIDSDPRHTTYDPETQRTVSHHLDCGAAEACVVCIASENLTGGKRGADLVEHIATTDHGNVLAAWLGSATPEWNPEAPDADQAG